MVTTIYDAQTHAGTCVHLTGVNHFIFTPPWNSSSLPCFTSEDTEVQRAKSLT